MKQSATLHKPTFPSGQKALCDQWSILSSCSAFSKRSECLGASSCLCRQHGMAPTIHQGFTPRVALVDKERPELDAIALCTVTAAAQCCPVLVSTSTSAVPTSVLRKVD